MTRQCGPLTVLAALAALVSVVVGGGGPATTGASTAKTRRFGAFGHGAR